MFTWMRKINKRLMTKLKNTGKKSLVVYFVLRALIIFCMILTFIRKDYNSTFLCALSLLLFTLPTLIEDAFQITLPTVLESIIYVFIFSAEILGEINNFYFVIPHWDTILHTLNGFLAAGVGFSLVDILNRNSKHVHLSPIFVSIVAFCFSMTIGVLWEFTEYALDMIIETDAQKDVLVQKISTVYLDPLQQNNPVYIHDITGVTIHTCTEDIVVSGGYLDVGLHDTMKDMIVNLIGAVCFSVFGYLYILDRDRYHFIKNFIPKVKM
ncbi:MAG: hypothetical protein IJO78_01170 [Erysipelotrichaceae bacterium]|nr:hypothetical protein [Erysipelotrichaceae bacterium]